MALPLYVGSLIRMNPDTKWCILRLLVDTNDGHQNFFFQKSEKLAKKVKSESDMYTWLVLTFALVCDISNVYILLYYILYILLWNCLCRIFSQINFLGVS